MQYGREWGKRGGEGWSSAAANGVRLAYHTRKAVRSVLCACLVCVPRGSVRSTGGRLALNQNSPKGGGYSCAVLHRVPCTGFRSAGVVPRQAFSRSMFQFSMGGCQGSFSRGQLTGSRAFGVSEFRFVSIRSPPRRPCICGSVALWSRVSGLLFTVVAYREARPCPVDAAIISRQTSASQYTKQTILR